MLELNMCQKTTLRRLSATPPHETITFNWKLMCGLCLYPHEPPQAQGLLLAYSAVGLLYGLKCGLRLQG
jgi:hypothetical protein